MKYDIKTNEDYKKIVYEYFGSQEKYARFIHQFNPEANFSTISRTVIKKANGETKLANHDLIILNMAIALLDKQ